MQNPKNEIPIKIMVENPPTTKQAEEHIKKLSEHPEEIWHNSPENR